MYVKSLSLKGFKSFADPVTMELQPGVNVVVGPNGSGKSNVIDAVAWVLGAQGAKALRGGKMDDVIFAGTGKRPALGRAEVSLTIDNSDGRIPVEFSEVTITRTLFRTGESEYAINGVSCRLLDIQELLSDTGVGRQQHVIVSQGNLAAILNARPEDRRMVVEEAAGVLKHRKRREKSQRRLEATEQNLERIQDLVREVRQQLRPLAKQAEAAKRHGEVSEELRGIKLHVAGRDIESLRHRIGNAEADFAELHDRDEGLRRELASSDVELASAEAEAGTFRGDELGDRVERLQGAFQRARGIGNVMDERRRTIQSELSAQVSKDVVSSLEHDASNVAAELEGVEAEREELAAPFEALAHDEQVLAGDWLRFEEEWGEGLPVATNEAAQVRGEASSLRRSIDGIVQEVERRSQRVAQLRSQAEQLAADVERATADQAAAKESQQALEAAVVEAEEAGVAARAAFDEVEGELRAAEQQESVARARVEALSSALDASRAKAGVERLADLDGIVGTLADLVEVEEGFQAAFEAAAGEAMAAVVVGDLAAARRALDKLRSGEDDGAVLVAGQPIEPPGGVPEGATGAVALRPKVRGTSPAVELLLDRILCCCVVVDGSWQQALDLAVAYPDIVVVTPRGDRFSRASWRIGTGGQGATVAAVAAAQADADAAAASLAGLRERFAAARDVKAEAGRREHVARKAASDNERRIGQAANAVERASNRTGGIDAEIQTIEGHVAQLVERRDQEAERLGELEARLPALEAAEASGEERARLWREARSVLEDRAGTIRNHRKELEVRSRSLEQRHQFLSNRLADLRSRLERHRVEVEQAAERRVRLQSKIAVLDRLRALVADRVGTIESHLHAVRAIRDEERERQRVVLARLEEVRKRRSDIERELLQIAERRQQHEVRQTELRMRLEGILEALRTDLGVEPEDAMAAPEPDLPQGKTAKQRMADLERELRQMGPINPLALEEYTQVEERHQFLDQQLKDIQESRRELARVIRAVDAEIVDVFRRAFDDVSRNFDLLFTMLFPGGTGKLRLTDPENPLETGIEIEAKPSGKNVRTLSLLSGGERSLAAMAFLFAVFRSRPSPFYLLDEVEAALDDWNLSRFLMLIDEFRHDAQLVVVSHQKRTMEKADCLYGVSMQPGGSTKVVSQRVEAEIDLTEQGAAS